jgi:GNAT superfamily N-acetyltransferase
MEHSLCFGVFRAGRQIAFARVVTDQATFAYLADVYVLEEFRGRGLSKWMLDAVVADPRLQGLRRFTLATRDAHGLYARYGFRPPETPQTIMEIRRPGLYRSAVQ